MARRTLVALMAFVLPICNLSSAEVVRGKWQKVDNLAPASPITITTRPGERLKCTYFSSDRETLLVVEAGGKQRRIPKSVIQTVIAEKYDDRLINGAVVGLIGGITSAALLATLPKDMSHRTRVTTGIFGGVLFGLTGLGIGALIDYHHQGSEVIYQALPPKD